MCQSRASNEIGSQPKPVWRSSGCAAVHGCLFLFVVVLKGSSAARQDPDPDLDLDLYFDGVGSVPVPPDLKSHPRAMLATELGSCKELETEAYVKHSVQQKKLGNYSQGACLKTVCIS